jgi:osmotically-inducible protein OsmY
MSLSGPGEHDDSVAATCSKTPPGRIKERAERALRKYPYLILERITCEYEDGRLILRGCLPSYFLKQVAQTAVAHLEGVENVMNEIDVLPKSRRP